MDFEAINFGRGAEAEERAGVVLRRVASAADDFAALAQFAGREIDDRAGRVARTLLRGVADEFDAEPVVLRGGDVAEDRGRAVDRRFADDLSR